MSPDWRICHGVRARALTEVINLPEGVNEEWAETDAGHIVVRESAPGRWRVTWYPNPGEPDFPGFTLDSATGAFPVDGGAAGILAWAKQQPWARRRRAASKPRSHPSDKPRAGRTGH